jgi:hypothetical protein
MTNFLSRFTLFLVYFSHHPLPNQTYIDKRREYLCALVSYFTVILAVLFAASMAFTLYFGGILNGNGIRYYGMNQSSNIQQIRMENVRIKTTIFIL